MTLNQYAANRRLGIFEELQKGAEPSGEFDAALLNEARKKGAPQMGTTRYLPDAIFFEFIYPDPNSVGTVLTIKQAPPEPIVYMPVPAWVVENIWQGDIEGTYHFATDASRLLREFELQLAPDANRAWFDRQPAKRRE